MLKFVKHHMESIEGIEIYPLISFLIFGLYFIVAIMWVWKMSKDKVSELERIPLSDNAND